jgi:hypothetical protein
MQITSNIFQVGGSELTSPEDASIYLVCFGDSAAVLMPDAGMAMPGLSKISRTMYQQQQG